jgi:hypothetical protein
MTAWPPSATPTMNGSLKHLSRETAVGRSRRRPQKPKEELMNPHERITS